MDGCAHLPSVPQVRLHVKLSVPSDAHVFAPRVPDAYTPLSLQVEPLDGLDVGQPVLPTPQPYVVEGLEEQLRVHEGAIRTTIPLRFTKNLGATVVALQVEYQACTPTVCFPPAVLRVEVALNGLDLIRD